MPGIALAVAAVIAGGIAWTFGAANNARKPNAALWAVSAQGTKVALPPNDLRTKRLHGTGIDDLTLLGTIGGRSIYRMGDSAHPCYGAGNAAPGGRSVSLSVATPRPTSRRGRCRSSTSPPSGWIAETLRCTTSASRGSPPTGSRASNFSIETGATVERLPVHANVYGAESLPTMTGVRLVALDERGNALGDATP